MYPLQQRDELREVFNLFAFYFYRVREVTLSPPWPNEKKNERFFAEQSNDS